MGFLIMKLWEGVASAFRRFFHPPNRNDDLKESGVGVGVTRTLGVGVGVGILGKLGVGVGPYSFRLRNPERDQVFLSRIRKLMKTEISKWSYA